MDTTDIRNASDKSRSRSSDSIYRIIAVQFFACAFIIGLILLVFRLGGAQQLKDRYSEIMSQSINVSGVIDSAKDVVESVIKPVEESSEEVNQTDKNNEETEIQLKESSAKSERTTAQVMSLFSDTESITVPAHGEISSLFGYRTDPISGVNKLHSALDIAVDEGTKVAAAWDGIVTKSGYDATAGNYVWMVHKNGCETLYCHCSEIIVKEGDVIRAGETLALSGNTGYSTGPHLHFGIKKDGEMVNPLKYLNMKDGKV